MKLITKTRFSSSRKIGFSVSFTFFSVLIFDVLVASSSAMQFRPIYDLAFGLIMFVLGYVSMLLINGEMLSQNGFDFVFPSHLYLILIIPNLFAIFSLIWLGTPNIGFINENILFQGLSGLLPLVNFIMVMVANAAIVYVSINRNTDISLYKLAAYLLGVLAVETCLAIYGFQIAGIEGIRWILSLTHITFIGLAIWTFQRLKTKGSHVRIAVSDLLLILLSVGIFALVYVPFGLYGLYGDNAVVAGSVLSIVNRGSLQPYYIADAYYSPIMGFVSVIFAYTTGLNNLILSSNLPFLIGSLALPFVTYDFIKSFITNDSRIVVIGVIVASLMDGLAVILLPLYAGNLTISTINWYISPATESLYSSNICQLWLTPFKAFASVSAIAACAVLHNKQVINYVLGGALFFISFTNPRYSILTIILLIFLFGIRKIDVKGITLFGLSVMFLGGPTLPVHVYKELLGLSDALYRIGFISETSFNQSLIALKSLVDFNALPIIITIVSMALLEILLIRLHFSKKTDDIVFTFGFSPKSSRARLASRIDIILVGIIMSILVYAILYAYSPNVVGYLVNNTLFAVVSSIILRYHILIAFFAAGLVVLTFSRRISLAIISAITLFLLGGIMTRSLLLIPLLFVILAIPFLDSIVRQKKRLLLLSFLCFVFLGVFSATFYSATVTAPTNKEYTDLPYVLDTLLKNQPGEPVYSPSSYTYYANRVLTMAHLELSSNPDCALYLIDKDYIQNEPLERLLKDENFTILYNGDRFAVLEKH